MNRTMQQKAGIALLLGALLSIFRVLPIVLSDGVTGDNFPPESVDDIIFFARKTGWYVSHVLFLALLPLLGFGMTQHSRVAGRGGSESASLMGLIVFGFSLITFSVAVFLDGFVLPHVAENPKAATAGSPEAALVLFTHETASIAGGTASALLLVAMLFIGLSQFQGLNQRRLGIAGIAIGLLSALGYLTGFLDLNISEGFNRVSPLLMASFIYLAVTGIGMIRPGEERTPTTTTTYAPPRPAH